MAKAIFHSYNRIPASSKLITITILIFHLGMLPVAKSSWLSFGKFRGLQQTIGTRTLCDHMSLVPKQKAMCLEDPKVMESVGDGAFQGIQECQYQFRNERWNCSISVKGQTVFGKVINPGSKEASFVHAITTAGVMYAVTRACSRGDINSCSCDRRKYGTGVDEKGEFFWGGCSDDIGNGTYFVREFVDASEIDVHDARAQMNLHNNRAGTRAVKKFVRRQCRCHGKTGSCTLRTCWDSLGDFRLTGEYLKDRHDNAIRVTVTQNGPKANVVSAIAGTQPSKNDLVYLESSPDYCRRNNILGTYGTAGRECNATSNGNDSCEKLCCGRGYVTKKVKKTEDCKCEFHWCCEVRCKKCEQIVDLHTCKGEDEFDIATTSRAPATSTEISSTIPSTILTTKSRRKSRKGGKGKKSKRRRDGKKRRKNRTRTKREIISGDIANRFKSIHHKTVLNRRRDMVYEAKTVKR